jgi:hypothetical protein
MCIIKQRCRPPSGISSGPPVMESVLEAKAATFLQFIHGVRGDLQVTFEEGIGAAWLHDLLTLK